MKIKRGGIYYFSIPYHTGSEIAKDRPGVVVSCDPLNETSHVVSVVFLSMSNKHDLPEHVTIRSGKNPRIALCEQITPVDTSRIQNYIGKCTDAEMQQIDIAMMCALGIEVGLQAPAKAEQAEEHETAQAVENAKEDSTERFCAWDATDYWRTDSIEFRARASAFKEVIGMLLDKAM